MTGWIRHLSGPPRSGRLTPSPLRLGRLVPGPLRFFLGVCGISVMSLAHPGTARGGSLQEAPDGVQRTVWDGVYTEEQAGRGQVRYTEVCAACHAQDLRGDNTSPSLVGQSFSFLFGGLTLGELFGKIQRLMPPDRPGTLSAQGYRDILAFIMSVNLYPSGEQELGKDDLDQIIISSKPDPGA